MKCNWLFHCTKSVRIRSFSGPCFSTFGLNTDGEIGTKKLRIRTLFMQCLRLLSQDRTITLDLVMKAELIKFFFKLTCD